MPSAIGRGFRLLIVLNQGTYSATELSDIIGEPVNSVSNHLRELADGGAIEVAEIKRCRNFFQHFYRAVAIPSAFERGPDRDASLGAPDDRSSLVAQSLLAEIMAALLANRISDDPNHCFLWDRLNVDEQGRREITEEQERHWERLEQIEEESSARSIRSGDATTPYIVSALGFERAREVPFVGTSRFGDCQASSD